MDQTARRARWPAILAAAALAVPGCRFAQLGSEIDRISRFGVLAGGVAVEDWSGAPIAVAVATRSGEWNAPFEVVAHIYLSEPGYFEFTVPAGIYHLGAVEDLDRGSDLDLGERFALLPRPIAVGSGKAVTGLVLKLDQRLTDDSEPVPLRDARAFVAGVRSDLDHPRFSRSAASAGLWRPLDTMERDPAGLFVLEEVDATRTPVVFVHGMSGTARDFRALIGRLDRERFQPWVYQYPSALPIDLLAAGLVSSLAEMHTRYAFERVCIVAHSMGGLVARRAVGRLVARARVPVRGLVTIASPLGGVSSAETGVQLAPAVVPSWRDLSPGSDFLRDLYASPLPDDLPYYLLFAFLPGQSSDGVVEIASQLRPEAQLEAERERGFAGTHAGVLGDPGVEDAVFELLDRCRSEPGAPESG